MIETRHVNSTAIAAWCESYLKPRLAPDVSSYSRGRLRCWLGDEPHLGGRYPPSPGVEVDDATWEALERWVEWRFDYCLVTWSGPDAAGILPHRDASTLGYEVIGWNLTGTSTFHYWQGRQTFGRTPDIKGYRPSDPPTHVIRMEPGTLVRFNAKNYHSADPSPNRWGMNFWRAK